jgi:ankyrin repeat protein
VALQSLEAISSIATSSILAFNWDRNGLTPMHLAVSLRLQASLRVLLHSQEARNNENDTTEKEESDLPDLAFIDVKDVNGNTPLHVAVTSDWKAGVSVLLEAGADVCQRNCTGATVVHLAAESGNSDILKEILSIHESKTVRHKSLLSSSTVSLSFVVSVYVFSIPNFHFSEKKIPHLWPGIKQTALITKELDVVQNMGAANPHAHLK